MKAIIVDDEVNGIVTLRKMLENNCPQVTVLASCSSAAAASQKLQELEPDVVFLDIQMPGKNGIEMLMDLSRQDFEVVFVTAHNEYMLQALQYSAADYLLKPVDEDRLMEAVQRVEKRRAAEKENEPVSTLAYNIHKTGMPMEMRLCLPTLKGFTVLKLDEIVYCAAERSYTIVHLVNKKSIIVSKPLSDYDSLLTGTNFLRVHKSYLVNLQHVIEYQRGEGGTVIMTNGAHIEVSRRKKEPFMTRMKELFHF